MKNKKQVIAAILGALIALLTAVYSMIDDDPTTTPDVTGTIEAVSEGVETVRENTAE